MLSRLSVFSAFLSGRVGLCAGAVLCLRAHSLWLAARCGKTWKSFSPSPRCRSLRHLRDVQASRRRSSTESEGSRRFVHCGKWAWSEKDGQRDWAKETKQTKKMKPRVKTSEMACFLKETKLNLSDIFYLTFICIFEWKKLLCSLPVLNTLQYREVALKKKTHLRSSSCLILLSRIRFLQTHLSWFLYI